METIENEGKVAATGLAVFAVYEVVKWGVSALFTLATGGGSLAVMGCMS